jgi:hypothetical protein
VLPPPVNATISPGGCVLIGTIIDVDASGFNPGEELSVAISRADGVRVDFDPIEADEEGRVRGFLQALLPPNVYALSFTGTDSGNEAIIYLKTVDR